MVRRLLALVAACVACSSSEPRPEPNTAGAPFRRLTRTEYNNTVRDLLGITSRPADTFPPEEQANGFSNNSEVLGVSQVLAEQYMQAAETLADVYTREVNDVLPGCVKTDGEPCAVAFIQEFGRKAFRRPLTQEEVDTYTALWRIGKEAAHLDEGIEMVVQAMLQSPYCLYRIELGEPGGPSGLRRPTSFEMASRLSYLLWGTMPDEEHFAAATAGALSTPDEIEAQARRMVDDPRARETLRHFFEQWLELELIDSLDKDTNVYPAFRGEIRPLLKHEVEAFIDHVVWEGSGDLTELFTAPYTFMNKPLADFYGVSGPTGDEFVRVELDPARHAGILTQAGILASFSKPNQSSPIHRGKWVRERLLCNTLPSPPPDLEIKPPDLDPNLTTRERFSQHRDDPFCAGCHELMDPIGLAFEHYDGIGLWRDLENGFEIDDSGHILGTDVEGDFNGPVELAHKLGASTDVRACVALSLFRFSYGRSEGPEDAYSVKTIADRIGGGQDVRELLVALTQTDAFLYLPAAPGGEK